MKLAEHLAEIHGEENVHVRAGGVLISLDCDCDRCQP